MIAEIKDFIGVYSNVLPEGVCEHLVAEFDRNINFSQSRQEAENSLKHHKDDQAIFMHNRDLYFSPFAGDKDAVGIFWDGLQRCYNDYSDKFSTLKEVDIVCNSFKMQKTVDGGGYHVWHSENTNFDVAHRVVAYMLYLNTLPEESNGETEFLHQKRRVRPVENTMVLWPAAYTHTHRGNPVYGDTAKYIITGWFVLR